MGADSNTVDSVLGGGDLNSVEAMLDKQIAILEKNEKLKYLQDQASKLVLLVIWTANYIFHFTIWMAILVYENIIKMG